MPEASLGHEGGEAAVRRSEEAGGERTEAAAESAGSGNPPGAAASARPAAAGAAPSGASASGTARSGPSASGTAAAPPGKAPAPAPAPAPGPAAPEGARAQGGDRPATPPPGPAGVPATTPPRREPLWALAMAASYGVTLFVASDDLIYLAIPGLLSLAVLELLGVRYFLRRPGRGSQAPYATDGSDRRGVVNYLYAALLKRYLLLVLLSLALMAVPLVTRATYLFPLMGVGLLGVVLATVCWFDQLRWVQQCARVLSVYTFEWRSPVYQLELLRHGGRVLVLGYEGLESPDMCAREPMGHPCWPERIAEGAWFAGDEVFGGALLVPGTGELMCLQPLDWDAFDEWRAAADEERRSMAKRAGLDRRTV